MAPMLRFGALCVVTFGLPLSVRAEEGRNAGKAALKSTPLEMTIKLITQLQGKVVNDLEGAEIGYGAKKQWCGNKSSELQSEIASSKEEVEMEEANFEGHTSSVNTAQSDISKLSGEIARDEADWKAILALNEHEKLIFSATDGELKDIISTLDHASQALCKRGAAKPSNSFLQRPTRGMQLFDSTFRQLLHSSEHLALTTRSRLHLVQHAARVTLGGDGTKLCKSLSGMDCGGNGSVENVVKALLELACEAESKQESLRKAENERKHRFVMFKQKLDKLIKNGEQNLGTFKEELSTAQGGAASARGNADEASKTLGETEKRFEDLKLDCVHRAQEYSKKQQDGKAELAALAEAKKKIQSAVDFVQVAPESSLSFLQTGGRLSQKASVALQRLRRVARTSKSLAAAQLASKVSSLLHLRGQSGQDPLLKVRGLIADTVAKLEKTIAEDQTKNDNCVHELQQNADGLSDKGDDLDKLSAKSEQTAADLAKAQENRKMLLLSIGRAVSEQTEADKIRNEAHNNYVSSAAACQKAVNGIQQARRELEEYYGGKSKPGASQVDLKTMMSTAADTPETSGSESTAPVSDMILELLRSAEEEYAAQCSQLASDEDIEKNDYDKSTQEDKVLQTEMQTRVANLMRDITRLEGRATELAADHTELGELLKAMQQSKRELEAECSGKEKSHGEIAAEKQELVNHLTETLKELEDTPSVM